MNFPSGYFTYSKDMNMVDILRFKDELKRVEDMEGPIIMYAGIEFHPFAHQEMPDAFCMYCGIANLKTSMWCKACGAPLYRA